MADIAALVEELSKLTVLEAADLAKALEEAWACRLPPLLPWLLPAGGGEAALLLKRRPNSTSS
jgi:large subunit ribosomal protein L7/L12